MTSEEKYKELIEKVKAELDKLKDIEDDKVKEIYSTLSELVSVEISSESSSEENTEESATTETESTEESTEENSVEKNNEEESAEVTTEKSGQNNDENEKISTEEGTPASEQELSYQVVKKLDEAAIELKKYEDIVASKEEIILVQNQKIVELTAELDKYKETENKIKEDALNTKIDSLVELYAAIGMKKDAIELKANFNESQIDNLIIDMTNIAGSAKNKIESKPVRITKIQGTNLELSNKKNEITEADRVKLLFDL